MMTFRKTTAEDIDRVMEIIAQGKAYLKASGVDQWQDDYPDEEVIKQDVVDGYGYVLEREGSVVGTVALSFDGEPWYDNIYDGKWLTNGDFLVIHRLAVSDDVRGTDAASVIMKQAEELCVFRDVKSIKIDTHEDNVIMQKFIKKNGFEYCGMVILGSEGERLCYELVL